MHLRRSPGRDGAAAGELTADLCGIGLRCCRRLPLVFIGAGHCTHYVEMSALRDYFAVKCTCGRRIRNCSDRYDARLQLVGIHRCELDHVCIVNERSGQRNAGFSRWCQFGAGPSEESPVRQRYSAHDRSGSGTLCLYRVAAQSECGFGRRHTHDSGDHDERVRLDVVEQYTVADSRWRSQRVRIGHDHRRGKHGDGALGDCHDCGPDGDRFAGGGVPVYFHGLTH